MNAKDTFKRELVGGVHFPRLKGHVAIRLHNPTTGKTEVIEGDNMITNAVKDIFAANLCGSMDYTEMLPLYSKMFGGVLLFGNNLDTESEGAADDYFIPDEGANPLIAHAGQNTYSSQSDDPKRGNPLDSSMVVHDGVVTLAWEWGSQSGNGTIKSLGLTHADVGDAGTGSTSNAFKAMTPNINANFGLTPTKKVAFIDKNGYGYEISVSGSTLTITRFPIAYQSVGLVGLNYNYISGIQSTKTVTLGVSHSGQPYFCFDKDNNKLYLFYNTSKSTTLYIDVVDISNWNSISVTHPDWNLQTQVGPVNVGGNDPQPFALPICRGFVYLPIYGDSNGTGFLRVQLSSTGNQTIVSGNFKGATGVFAPDSDNKIIAGKCFVINNGVVYGTSIASPDVVNNATGSNYWETAILDQGEGLVQMTRLKMQNSANWQYYPSISKFYLATKFKLDTPVTKTASQSMTVTYTLTEV